ncbi:hypothetical protein [Novacetimonas hansenii]|uniref:HK97 gp10 family phage protein n=1 Tax=Novacetimonas hansenii TaxID=436 RepID=A0ABQ0SHE5_NOVHA|nr:hypothetical protein [Novacetimonas hansenii]GAN84040.1 hypothetical protein Gaha_0122_040 [Novacetimonas hansenii JCM 7643]GBQ55851.1 hypothetical protein AA0243_1028 [Novacetimonas hansenii NRIC 0243]GEC64620.1 hypothetical protein GHA01_24690 [Novacetimonas hansenii]
MQIQVNEVMLKINMKPLRKELRIIAKEVKAKVQTLLRNSVPSGVKRGSHTASAPGEVPSLMNGLLAKAITYKIKKNKITITDGAYYALFLSAGAKNTGKSHKGTILPRPFMSVVLDEMKDEIEKRITNAVMNGITTN